MNSIQIRNLLVDDHRIKDHFRGVFASDQLPNSPKFGIYIINLDPSNLPGSHWVAAHILNKDKVEYFDSYGLPPLKLSIIRFLNSFTVIRNSFRLQNYKSDLCGEYCCLYTLYKCTGRTLQDYLSQFTRRSDLNDCRLLHLLQEEFRYVIKRVRTCHPNAQSCCSKYSQVKKKRI
nr:TPA_asm: adenain [Ladona dragonfly adintovirus]